MKKFIGALVCMMLVILPLTSFAAPEFLGSSYTGTSSKLIDILNPDSFSTTTTNSICVVSAAASKSTTVAIYLYDPSTKMYRKINTYFNGVKLEETTVGASGLYARQVLLKQGINKILVYAQKGSKVQTTRLEITLLKDAYVGNLKSYISSKVN